MLVLLRAEAIVKPPIRSMMVGENITENTHLRKVSHIHDNDEAECSLCCTDRTQPLSLTVLISRRANDAEANEKQRN